MNLLRFLVYGLNGVNYFELFDFSWAGLPRYLPALQIRLFAVAAGVLRRKVTPHLQLLAITRNHTNG